MSQALLLGLLGAAALASKRSAAPATSSLWANLPDKLHGDKAQQLLMAAVLATGVNDWHIVSEDRGGTTVTVLVSNAVKVDGVRVSNVLYSNAQRLADRIGLLLPTTRIADMAHRAAVVRFGAEHAYVPLIPTITAGCALKNGQPTVCRGGSRDATVGLSAVVDKLVAGRTGLADNEGKWFVIDRALFVPGAGSGIYGWWRSDGSLVQSKVTAHPELGFSDYSQVLRFVGPTTVIQPAGQPPFEMPTGDVYTSSTWAHLLVKGGPLPGYRHPGVMDAA